MYTIYEDSFCRIDIYKEEGFALYGAALGAAIAMPIRWAYKVRDLFRSGQIDKACHYIDMAESVGNRRYVEARRKQIEERGW